MALHLISAGRLVEELAVGRVTPRQQASYLTVSFCVWVVASYLYLIPIPATTDQSSFFWWVWLLELFLLVLLYITGISFCLRKCRIEPQKNFLIDFSCLLTPVTVTTLLAIWGGFHLLTTVPAWILLRGNFASDPLPWLTWLQSSQVYDVMRLLASVAVVIVILLRLGKHMERLSSLRESANDGVQPTPKFPRKS